MPFIVQMRWGSSIHLANALINTEDFEATTQFDSLEFYVATTKAAIVPIHSITFQGHPARLNSVKNYALHGYFVQKLWGDRTTIAKAIQQNKN